MSSCCNTDQAVAVACPDCAAVGPVVGVGSVLAHRPSAVEGPWQFCATAGCPVVFHLAGQDRVVESELRTRVAHKALDAPEPVCFCFSHTRADLAADVAVTGGKGTIKASIKRAVADGMCACEHLNPSGGCCVASVHRALKEIAAETTMVSG